MKITILDLTNSSQNNIDIDAIAEILKHDIDGAELITKEKVSAESVWMKSVEREQ